MSGYARADFDSVAPLMPSDKVTGRVSSRGEHFDWVPTHPGLTHSSSPLHLRAASKSEIMNPHFVDLTGSKIGRLTVQGLAAEVVTGNGTNWVVRCVCGAYETRKSKFIKSCLAGNNPGDEPPMCNWCGKTNKLRMGKHDPAKAAAAAEAIRGLINASI